LTRAARSREGEIMNHKLTTIGVAALLAFALGWLLAACNDISTGQDEDWFDWPPTGGSQPTGDDDDDDTAAAACETAEAPTWTNFGECFFTAYCTSCHTPGGSAPFSLASYSEVKAHLDASVGSVNSGSMPPGQPEPSEAEIQLLNDWADAGAPE
jgi:hypothetical protein